MEGPYRAVRFKFGTPEQEWSVFVVDGVKGENGKGVGGAWRVSQIEKQDSNCELCSGWVVGFPLERLLCGDG